MLRHMLSTLLAACPLVLGAACSNEPPGDAAPGASGFTKLDDMEGNAGLTWWSATDCTEVDRISPTPYMIDSNGWSFAALPTPHETFQGVVSTHAARLRTTSPLTAIWGANMGFELAPTTALAPPTVGTPCRQPTPLNFTGTTVDLSAYSGVTFWGMADPAGAKVIVVALQDRNTDPRGGACNAADPSGGNCDNGFGTRVELTDTLTQYTIDFSTLFQNHSWGYHPNPDVPDLQHVYAMTFDIDEPGCGPAAATYMCPGGSATQVSFDFWIDDVYLVNK
jgi:hypothetical protein